MSAATLTSKGQVTIPRDVRTSLGLSTGDRVDFLRLEGGGYAIVPAARSVRALKGALPPRDQPVSLEEMDAAIKAGALGA